MNNKNIILFVVIIAVAVGGYFLFMNRTSPTPAAETEMTYTEEAGQTVYCDEAGNRYNTVEEAKAVGLSEAEYGATYCPEYVAAKTGDYKGLTVSQAEEISQARGEQFRVIEIDGQPQPTTRDFQEGRINASVTAGVITAYTVETNSPAAEATGTTEVTKTTQLAIPDAIVGMTITAAEAYAKTKGVDFRTGTVDGVAMAVTADFRPGRITAEIKNGVVVSYTVEK